MDKKKKMSSRLIKSLIGQIIYSLAISLTCQASIGYATWDVFHSGVSNLLHCSIGTSITIISVVLFAVAMLMKWPIGISTVSNVFLCGIFVDIFNLFIPVAGGLISGIIEFFIGIIIFGFATYMYIEPGLGASVRDSLFVWICQKTKLPTAAARAIMDASLAFIGWLMGGQVGLGSVLCLLFFGLSVQTANRIMHFNLAEHKHEDIISSFRSIKNSK